MIFAAYNRVLKLKIKGSMLHTHSYMIKFIYELHIQVN